MFSPASSVAEYPPDLCVIEYTDGTWSDSEFVCKGMYPSVTRNGTIYYDYHGHIVRRKCIDGVYQEMDVLGANVYSEYQDGHPFIAPDEEYLIFDSGTRPGVEGNALFVSFRMGENEWTEPQNLSDLLGIKPSGKARVSYDGQHLFFTSGGDIYWVSADVIEVLRPSESK
jgi:hypothetical protein